MRVLAILDNVLFNSHLYFSSGKTLVFAPKVFPVARHSKCFPSLVAFDNTRGFGIIQFLGQAFIKKLPHLLGIGARSIC